MSENKYLYLLNKNDIITHYSAAIRGDDYKLSPDGNFDYTYNAGAERQYFTLKNNNNIFYVAPPGGESENHYNAKLKIAHEKKYYDTIFNQWIEFDSVIPEFYHDIKKRPDLSCYDKNNNLVCCIEIYCTSKKTIDDIELLKKLKVPIIEINIKDDNKCNHIILPEILEINRPKLAKLNLRYCEVKIEYDKLAQKLCPGTERIENEFINFKKNSKNEFNYRIKKIDNWLQKRINHKKSGIDFDTEIRKLEIILSKTNQDITIIEYSSGKQQDQIDRITEEIRNTTNAFKEIADRCRIEWFRNSWMTYKVQNLIQEITYWLS